MLFRFFILKLDCLLNSALNCGKFLFHYTISFSAKSFLYLPKIFPKINRGKHSNPNAHVEATKLFKIRFQFVLLRKSFRSGSLSAYILTQKQKRIQDDATCFFRTSIARHPEASGGIRYFYSSTLQPDSI